MDIVPWTDRKGAFAPLKAITLALVLAPSLWLAWRGFAGELGSKPLTAAIHDSGDWAVRFLLAALAITPFRSLLRQNGLIQIRRMLGLAALGYTLLHLALYIALEKLDMVKVVTEIVLRTYLSIGFLTLIGLAMLGWTSTDGAIRRMGAERWGALHRMVYLLAILSLLHFALQTRIDVSEPVLMTGLFLWLMGWRWLRARKWEGRVLALAGLSLAAGLATALIEALWYGLTTGVAGWRVLAANLDFSYVVRPAWWVLAAGLAVTAVHVVRHVLAGPSGREAVSRRSPA